MSNILWLFTFVKCFVIKYKLLYNFLVFIASLWLLRNKNGLAENSSFLAQPLLCAHVARSCCVLYAYCRRSVGTVVRNLSRNAVLSWRGDRIIIGIDRARRICAVSLRQLLVKHIQDDPHADCVRSDGSGCVGVSWLAVLRALSVSPPTAHSPLLRLRRLRAEAWPPLLVWWRLCGPCQPALLRMCNIIHAHCSSLWQLLPFPLHDQPARTPGPHRHTSLHYHSPLLCHVRLLDLLPVSDSRTFIYWISSAWSVAVDVSNPDGSDHEWTDTLWAEVWRFYVFQQSTGEH